MLNAVSEFRTAAKFVLHKKYIMKSSTFWGKTPCSQLKVDRHFRGTCRLHLQGREISHAKNQCESRWLYLPHACMLVSRTCM
jgi:hypothetical protein